MKTYKLDCNNVDVEEITWDRLTGSADGVCCCVSELLCFRKCINY